MTEMHDRVRDMFHDLAEEMPRTPMLPRLDRQAEQTRWRHRLLLAAAVVAVLVAAVGMAVLVRDPNASEPLPAQQPPKMFRIAGIETSRPGTATLAVVVSDDTTMQAHEDVPAYVLPAAAGAALTVPGGHPIFGALQRLSADGTLLVREGRTGDTVRVLDLRTGREREYVVGDGLVFELSPGNRRIASYTDRGVIVTNLASGRTTTVRTGGHLDERGGLGWSPDGQRLALHQPGGTRIVDAAGATLDLLPNLTLVNGSISWSPSGRSILGYDEVEGTFVLASADGKHRTAIDKPTDTARLLGWTGPRLVWLTGAPGAQRLITTDERGNHRASWMLFPTGLPPVQTVTWANALSGAPSTAP